MDVDYHFARFDGLHSDWKIIFLIGVFCVSYVNYSAFILEINPVWIMCSAAGFRFGILDSSQHQYLFIMSGRINIESPRYDQSTFEGRAKHFFITTNPLTVFASDEELEKAKAIVDNYRKGTEDKRLTEDEIWAAKQLYDSAFHCQTGEKLFLLGRMSFQVPGNMLISGCMMTFYKTTPAVIFWQVMNQSFNAIVNYSNRNASVGVTTEQLGLASLGATCAGVITALGFNKAISASPSLSSGIVGRFVPLLAVAAANCVNIPLMRQQVRIEFLLCRHMRVLFIYHSFMISETFTLPTGSKERNQH